MTKHLRVSNVTAEQIAEAQSIAPVECVQNFYNLAKSTQLIVSTASIESRRKKGFRTGRGSNRALRPYVPFFPLGGFTPLQSETLSNVAARFNAKPMSVALAWLLQRSPNILLIPGTSSVEHLRENVTGAGIRLPDEAIKELNAIAG